MIIKYPKLQIRKLLSDQITLVKVTESEISEDWGDTKITTTEYTITGKIVPVTTEDLRFLPSGLLDLGDARGYFLPSYTVDQTTVTVDTGDRIKYLDIEYEVTEITRHIDENGNELYRECRLRRFTT